MSEVILIVLFGLVILFMVSAPFRGDANDRRVAPR